MNRKEGLTMGNPFLLPMVDQNVARAICLGAILALALLHLPFESIAAQNGKDAANAVEKTRESFRLSANLHNSSVVLPLKGSVYPDGVFFVTLWVGSPPKAYFLDVDTGSELTWLQCDAPCVRCFKGAHPLYKPNKANLVRCKDPSCSALGSLKYYECEEPGQQCDYLIEYADQSSSLGVIVKDKFYLRFTGGDVIQPSLTFGCGYDQQVTTTYLHSATDGVLGLASGKTSIISQLKGQGIVKNVIGHCMNTQSKVGYLFFGEGLIPSATMTWIGMHSHPSGYSPGPAKFIFGKQQVKDIMVVFDSGSSYTYLSSSVYEVFLSEVNKDLAGKPFKRTLEDATLPLCWQGPQAFRSFSDVQNYFKTLILEFRNSKNVQLEIPPENYLIITAQGSLCLGIMNGTAVNLEDVNLIGDISMQSHVIIYDNERNLLGWAPGDCSSLRTLDGSLEGLPPNYNVDSKSLPSKFRQCPDTYHFAEVNCG